jgi:hypothetical protein
MLRRRLWKQNGERARLIDLLVVEFRQFAKAFVICNARTDALPL